MTATGNVLLVTGGSRGIGAAVVQQAAALGWSVCFTYQQDAAAAAAVADGISAQGGSVSAVRADIAAESDIISAFDAAEQLGPLTAFVANAGIVAPQMRLEDMSAERVQRLLNINVLGTILCCREAIRRMSRCRGKSGGSVVLVSSAASRIGSAGEYVDYAASKAAVDTLGVGLAREVAADGIRINVVRPGIVATEIHARNGQPERLTKLAPNIPLGRPATSSEIAQAILWFIGDASSYCTGSILDVAGGR